MDVTAVNIGKSPVICGPKVDETEIRLVNISDMNSECTFLMGFRIRPTGAGRVFTTGVSQNLQ